MKPVLYLLSNRQRKDLLVRGTELRIALPVPPVEIDDPADWARSVLPTEFRDLIEDAEETEVYCQALKTDLTPDSADLTAHFGEIYEEPIDAIMLTIVVVVATLRPANCRHQSEKVQWPSKVEYKGEQLPRPKKMAH